MCGGICENADRLPGVWDHQAVLAAGSDSLWLPPMKERDCIIRSHFVPYNKSLKADSQSRQRTIATAAAVYSCIRHTQQHSVPRFPADGACIKTTYYGNSSVTSQRPSGEQPNPLNIRRSPDLEFSSYSLQLQTPATTTNGRRSIALNGCSFASIQSAIDLSFSPPSTSSAPARPGI